MRTLEEIVIDWMSRKGPAESQRTGTGMKALCLCCGSSISLCAIERRP